MTTLYPKITEADWSFVGTWVEEVALEAAENVHHAGGLEFSDELDDLKQHALLYVATHSKEIGKITSAYTLRKHLYSRLIRDFRGDWEKSREEDKYGSETDLYGEGWL